MKAIKPENKAAKQNKKNKNCFLVFLFSCFLKKDGQSLMEVIIAVAVFGLIVASVTSMVVGGNVSTRQGGQQTEALALAQEGIEAVRSIRDRAWNEEKYNQSGVATSSGAWFFSGEGTQEIIGDYTRTIVFGAICRDGSDNIVACPGTYTDPHSKKVTVTVSWQTINGVTDSVQKIAYLTNWHTYVWPEDTQADFADGTFSGTIATTTYGTGNGAVVLEEQH
jgi:Tfp pilus assembly protein PilV